MYNIYGLTDLTGLFRLKTEFCSRIYQSVARLRSALVLWWRGVGRYLTKCCESQLSVMAQCSHSGGIVDSSAQVWQRICNFIWTFWCEWPYRVAGPLYNHSQALAYVLLGKRLRSGQPFTVVNQSIISQKRK